MPLNENPTVRELLSWHGHDRGGVRVPFDQRGGNPLQQVIVTRLIEKLKELAGKIANGDDTPRWIFLIGGPGNGKSEAVQEFLSALDEELGCNGGLVETLRERFRPDPLVPWVVEITSDEIQGNPPSFKEKIGRLIVVQDASASDRPNADAAGELVKYVADLATHPSPLPVFICCINRGLLARALTVAHRDWPYDEVINVIKGLIRATALGKEALSDDRPKCWPLDLATPLLEGKVACWPMDMESLLLPPEHGGLESSPIEQVIENAVQHDRWEVSGSCADCDDSDLCPFRQNAAWLRDEATRGKLLKILRRAELATGQRWNFRDTFSLVAELMIGEWGDFAEMDHPCKWVHSLASDCRQAQSQPSTAIRSAFELMLHLYPHAMFQTIVVRELPEEASETAGRRGFDKTLAISDCVASKDISPTTHIRGLLKDIISPRLDPVFLSPHDGNHPIGKIEDAYSQSVAMGNNNWPREALMSTIESLFLGIAEEAEDEWDPLGRESAQVVVALKFLRILCSSIAKRSVGVKLGFHANNLYLQNYNETIRDEGSLNDLTLALRSLFGTGGFRFNALGSFGQPQSEGDWLINLQGDTVSIEPIAPAPTSDEHRPAHDYPFIQISGHVIPLTFDLYMALRLRKDGCESSSLPASVRAAIDRIQHLHAGNLCRNEDKFVQGSAQYVVKDHRQIVLPRRGDVPRLL